MDAHHSLRFEGRQDFQQALRVLLRQAAAARATEIVMADEDFGDWPLGEIEVVDTLAHWALAVPNGHCVLMGASFERFQGFPRWLAWRKTWAHRVRCLQAPDEWLPRMPSMLFVPGQSVLERLDVVHHRGVVSNEAAQLVQARERTDAISQRSTETLPVTTLGL